MLLGEMTRDEVQALLVDIPEAMHLRATTALLCGWTALEPKQSVVCSMWGTPPPGNERKIMVPDYPNDIAAVFRDLAPAMRERGFHWSAFSDRRGKSSIVDWRWTVFGKSPIRSDGDAGEFTPARAACLAAIRAIGWANG